LEGIVAEHRLRHHPEAARQARSITRQALPERLAEQRREDVVLMVTELVTNAVRHAPPHDDGRIALTLDVTEGAVRAAVIDGGGHFEFERGTFDARTPHFGLQLVDRLASRSGLSLDGVKAVWFEVDL